MTLLVYPVSVRDLHCASLMKEGLSEPAHALALKDPRGEFQVTLDNACCGVIVLTLSV